MMKDRAFKKLPTLTVILSLLFLCFGVIYHLIVVQLIYLFFLNYIFFFVGEKGPIRMSEYHPKDTDP